jgi:hypothetical protein
MLPQVLEAPGHVAEQPKKHVHRARLHDDRAESEEERAAVEEARASGRNQSTTVHEDLQEVGADARRAKSPACVPRRGPMSARPSRAARKLCARRSARGRADRRPQGAALYPSSSRPLLRAEPRWPRDALLRERSGRKTRHRPDAWSRCSARPRAKIGWCQNRCRSMLATSRSLPRACSRDRDARATRHHRGARSRQVTDWPRASCSSRRSYGRRSTWPHSC